ncbi:MAG: transposase [Verrucomicrobiota bacterium]
MEPAYCLEHLHRPPTVTRSLRLSRSRWNIEQYFQRGKDDLGLDHFEGRSWLGFHHHLVMAVLAYLFVVVVFLDAIKTSSVTWEQVLTRMRPWLLKSVGLCFCCGRKFEDVSVVIT